MAATATVASPAAAESGEDALTVRRWFGRAGWFFVIGLAVWFINHNEYPGPALRVLLVMALFAAACCGVAFLKRQANSGGQADVREKLLDSLALKGDEKLLEVGSGAGLFCVAAAKRLKTGKVTGADTWDPAVSSVSINTAKEYAKSEGVADRVRFDSSDPTKLVYPDNQFDAAVANQYLHLLLDHVERAKVLREMLRATKPGGRILIYDSGDTAYYAQALRESGAKDVLLSSWSFPGLVPHRNVSAQK